MKRILLLVYASFLWMGSALAENSITVGSAGVVTLPKGGQGSLRISYAFDIAYHGFQFTLDLANTANKVNGIIESEKPVATLGFNSVDHTITSSQVNAELNFLCVSFTNAEMPTSGTLINIPLTVSDDVTVGDVYTVKLKNLEFGRMGETPYCPDDITFTIQIGEPTATVVLNETSTTPPNSSGEVVNVTVNRSIKADTWSTICLPFNMTTAQIKTVFGDDVKLADFDSWSFVGTAPSVDAITVNFASATTITANKPCLIKVSNAINSFEVENVEIIVDEVESAKIYSIGSGKNKKNYTCTMLGTYVAGDTDAGDLFLSGNTFYVSNGTTPIKAYRAIFYFGDDITLPTAANAARVNMSFVDDGGTTKINQFDFGIMKDEMYYDSLGRPVVNPTKGLYIVNGRKIMIK